MATPLLIRPQLNDETQDEALARVGERDHSLTNHYRIFGPPGTGKTWHLVRQIHKAFLKYGPRILVTSHTRTAAYELVDRLASLVEANPALESQIAELRQNVRTLHSHCYRAMAAYRGSPIFLAEAHVARWNELHPSLPMTPQSQNQALAKLEDGLLAISMSENASSQDRADPEAAYQDLTCLDDLMQPDHSRIPRGDYFLAELNRLRGLGIDPALFSRAMREFYEMWTDNKLTHSPSLDDYADFIQFCHQHIHVAPGNPAVIFTDEAQDFNRVQSGLIKKWGRMAEYFVEAGDDDQTIFAFTGASPDSMLDPPLPEGHHIVLRQSYRLPRRVFDLAERWVRQIPPASRQAKNYAPRDHAGRISLVSPARLEKSLDEELSDPGRTVMILASCRYQLAPALRLLRDRAIPFHNPYRPAAAEWNPLRPGKYSIRAQVLALLAIFERPWWTLAEADCFTHGLTVSKDGGKSGALLHGARTKLERMADAFPDQIVRPSVLDLGLFFCPDALADLAAALAGDMEPGQGRGPAGQRGGFLLKWWQDHMRRPSRGKLSPSIRFTAQAALNWGAAALKQPPRVTIGTIHSVKGGEADTVFLHTDLSPAALEAWTEGDRDPTVRLFYVAITRARDHLALIRPDFGDAASIQRFLT